MQAFRRPVLASAFRLIQQSWLPSSTSSLATGATQPLANLYAPAAASLWPASRSLATKAAAAPDAIGAVKPKKEKKEKSTAPKRQSAYSLFTKDHFAEIQGQHPGLKLGEVASKLGEAWKALPESEKANYKAKAVSMNDAAGIVKKEKPKSGRPPTPYIKYFSENHADIRASMPAGTSTADVTREIAKHWKQLSEQEKAKYK